MRKKIRSFAVKTISFYQKTTSPDTGFFKRIGLIRKPVCVFFPSCSEYTKQAIEKYGIKKGFYLGVIRIFRCHPWQKNHIDLLK